MGLNVFPSNIMDGARKTKTETLLRYEFGKKLGKKMMPKYYILEGNAAEFMIYVYSTNRVWKSQC